MQEFEDWFGREERCREYLLRHRWPEGFRCPRCGNDRAWQMGRMLFRCTKCEFEISLTAGTLFQDTRKLLRLWFQAMWYVTNQKQGVNALGLQRLLGLGSYRTAWTWLHTLRRAMVRPGRDWCRERWKSMRPLWAVPSLGNGAVERLERRWCWWRLNRMARGSAVSACGASGMLLVPFSKQLSKV
jgi:ribosomal protein L37AE/L43A